MSASLRRSPRIAAQSFVVDAALIWPQMGLWHRLMLVVPGLLCLYWSASLVFSALSVFTGISPEQMGFWEFFWSRGLPSATQAVTMLWLLVTALRYCRSHYSDEEQDEDQTASQD